MKVFGSWLQLGQSDESLKHPYLRWNNDDDDDSYYYWAFPACMSDCVSNISRALLYSVLAGNLGDWCYYSHFQMRKLRNLRYVKLLMQGHKASMWQKEQLHLALWDGKSCPLQHYMLVLLGGRRLLLLLTAEEVWWNRKCTGFVMVTRKLILKM